MSEVIGAAAAILRPNIDPMIIAPRTPADAAFPITSDDRCAGLTSSL